MLGVSSDAFSDVDDTLSDVCDDDSLASMCTCGAAGRAHKRDCPMSSQQRYPAHACFPQGVVSEGAPLSSACEDVKSQACPTVVTSIPLPPRGVKFRHRLGIMSAFTARLLVTAMFPAALWGSLLVGISCTAQRGF